MEHRNIGQKFFEAQAALFEHVGFVPDWVEYAIDNHMDKVWSEDGKHVKYAKSVGQYHSDGDYYQDEIYTQRFYPKRVYRGEDITLIFCDPHTDAVKWFRVFDNSKEIKKANLEEFKQAIATDRLKEEIKKYK